MVRAPGLRRPGADSGSPARRHATDALRRRRPAGQGDPDRTRRDRRAGPARCRGAAGARPRSASWCRAATACRSTARRSAPSSSSRCPPRIRFPGHGDLLRPLPRLQGLARRRARRARAAARRRSRRARRRRRRRGRQHLLRHARGRVEVPQGGGPRGAHAPSRLRHRLRREPRRRRVRRAPGQRRRRRAPQRGDAGVRRRRRRRDRLRPGGRAARPRPRVRQGAGRLQLLLRVLRDPARARRARAAARAAAVLAEIRRRVEQGHREVVLTGINLGCYRDRAAGYDLPRLVREAGATPGLERLRLSLDRDQPRERRARRRAARDADGEPAPARAAPVRRRRRAARDGPPLHGRHLPPPARAAAGRVQPDERRDRRLPDRGRGGVREHAADRARRPA